MSELKPTYGDHFLLAFDYQPPEAREEEIQQILYIHSTQLDPSRKMLARLQDIYPKTNFSLLKSVNADFSGMDSFKKLKVTNYTPPTLSPSTIMATCRKAQNTPPWSMRHTTRFSLIKILQTSDGSIPFFSPLEKTPEIATELGFYRFNFIR